MGKWSQVVDDLSLITRALNFGRNGVGLVEAPRLGVLLPDVAGCWAIVDAVPDRIRASQGLLGGCLGMRAFRVNQKRAGPRQDERTQDYRTHSMLASVSHSD
jgi:hypothetical protein